MKRLPTLLLLLPALAVAQTYISAWVPKSQTSADAADAAQPTLINIRQIVSASFIPDEWGTPTAVKIAIQRHSVTTTLVLEGLSICERDASTDDCVAPPVRLQLGGSDISSANPFNITAAGFNLTDALTFNFDSTKSYLVLMWAPAGFGATRQWDAGSGTNSYTSTAAGDGSGTQTVTYTPNQRAFSVGAVQAVPSWQPPALTGINGMTTGDSFLDPLTGVKIVALNSAAQCPSGNYHNYSYINTISSDGAHTLTDCNGTGQSNRLYSIADSSNVTLLSSAPLTNCGNGGNSAKNWWSYLDPKKVYFSKTNTIRSCNVIDTLGGQDYTTLTTFSASCGGSAINGMEYRGVGTDDRYHQVMLQAAGVDKCWGVWDSTTNTWYTKPISDFTSVALNTICRGTSCAPAEGAAVVKIDLSAVRGYDVGQTVGINGVTDSVNFPNGTYVVASVVDTDTYTLAWAGAAAASSGGNSVGCNAGFDDSNMIADSGQLFIISNNSNVSATTGKCGAYTYQPSGGSSLQWVADGFSTNHQAYLKSSGGDYFVLGPRPIGNTDCPSGSAAGVVYKDGGFKPTGGLINSTDAAKFGKACAFFGNNEWDHFTANHSGDFFFADLKLGACNGLSAVDNPFNCAVAKANISVSAGTPTISSMERMFHHRATEQTTFNKLTLTSCDKQAAKCLFMSNMRLNTDQTSTVVQEWIAYLVLPPSAPVLNGIVPDFGDQNTVVPVTVTGTNMGGAAPSLNVSGTGVTVSNLSCAATSCTADLTIAAGAALGVRDVSLTTADGTSNNVSFTVNSSSAPTLTSVTPSSGSPGDVGVTLVGTNFDGSASIAVSGTGVTVSNITLLNPQTLVATFTITPGTTPGSRNVTVTTGAGTSGPQTFTVETPRVTGGVVIRGGVIIK